MKALHDGGAFRPRRVPLPVVSVGAISVGGAGKTPFVLWLAGRLHERGVPLAQLTLDELKAAHGDLDERVYEVLGVEKAIEAFASYGSTAPKEVARQVERWKEKLA